MRGGRRLRAGRPGTEVTEIIAAANAYTAQGAWGPDRVFGFSPIPAMSMVSYAAGARYLQLLGGVTGSFYDWYCDLPPASPQTWGEQTDVAESAGLGTTPASCCCGGRTSPRPAPRTPTFTPRPAIAAPSPSVICPDYSEASKFSDLWLPVKQGTDAALAMAFGHVILKEYPYR